ncbi:dead-box ATP-dependent RNA helicase 39 [Phtheirospermum japonicum]|uniref:Dead-box ATP-dependent RNA helicase 39 n=1 Tax=Phtheirospermum japonicum TaxID=374723 RepID=A0A830B3E7_9LAMI|nr:dead-box ATP-dependent RNA helicase 39 [Phtheirospermum japonicum]
MNSIDYLHRTGRTARMGTKDSIKRDLARSNVNRQKDKNEKTVKFSSLKNKDNATSTKSSEGRGRGRGKPIAANKTSAAKSGGKATLISKGNKKVVKVFKTTKSSGGSNSRGVPSSSRSKLNVVGFRGVSGVKSG